MHPLTLYDTVTAERERQRVTRLREHEVTRRLRERAAARRSTAPAPAATTVPDRRPGPSIDLGVEALPVTVPDHVPDHLTDPAQASAERRPVLA